MISVEKRKGKGNNARYLSKKKYNILHRAVTELCSANLCTQSIALELAQSIAQTQEDKSQEKVDKRHSQVRLRHTTTLTSTESV